MDSSENSSGIGNDFDSYDTSGNQNFESNENDVHFDDSYFESISFEEQENFMNDETW